MISRAKFQARISTVSGAAASRASRARSVRALARARPGLRALLGRVRRGRAAPATAEQQKDIDFLLTAGEIFTLVVYGQLILENAKIYDIPVEVLDQVFDFMVRDFSRYALEFHNKPSSSEAQMDYARRMIRKPVADEARYQDVWNEYVFALKGEYQMNP